MSRKVWWNGAWVDLGAGSLGSPLSDGAVTASTTWTITTAVADAATPHATGGAWVEVDASLSGAASGVMLQLTANTFVSTTNTSTLLEIGTGGAGAEAVWATVPVGYRVTPHRLVVPGYIAAGTRVAIRSRSAVLSKSVAARFVFLSGTVTAAPQTYGTDLAASKGVTLTAPGGLNTKSAWTEITAATSSAIDQLLVGVQAATGTGMAGSAVLIDIGVGAAASETVVVRDLFVFGDNTERYEDWSVLTNGVAIPAGSRIAARYARASASNAVDVILVGA